MTTPKRGLGKGLGALIPTSAEHSPQETPAAIESREIESREIESEPGYAWGYQEIDINAVVPNAHQPRKVFDEEALDELVFSISEIGLLQPIVVRPVDSGGFELVAGERRLRASKRAGLTHIPAIIRRTEDNDMLRDALLENLHRANLNALEEAAAYSQMLSDFDCTQEELATRIGRSRPQVTNTLRLLKLPTGVQQRVAAGVLSAGHARALLSLSSPEAMQKMAERTIKEGLSVRNLEELISLGQGDGQPRKRTERKRKGRPEALEEATQVISRSISEALDTRIAIEGFYKSGDHGKLVIECADIADARRISELIAKGSSSQ